MNLYWHGGRAVSLESSDSYLFADPVSAEKEPKITEGVVLFSKNSSAKGLPKDVFVIDTAGEYNVRDFFVTGLAGLGENVSYLIEADDIKLCYLTEAKAELTDEQLATISDVDVLIVNVGDSNAENELASKVVNQIEPRVVVPINFKNKPTIFLKEMGSGDVEAQNKFSIKKKDLPQEETKLVLLNIVK